MSNVEAAASLFGSEDSASDPFASLGANVDDGSQGINGTAAFDAGTPAPSDDFFAQQSHEWNTTQASGNTSHFGVQQQTYDPPSWQQQQHGGYAPSASKVSANSHEAHTPYQPGNHTASNNPYSAYQQRYDQAASHAVQSPPSANPYEPPQPLRQPSYSVDHATPARPANTVSQTAYGQPSYVSYSPTASTFQSASPLGASHASIPQPPPVTSSTVTRPKVSNAYDPPMIASRPSKRAVRPGITTPFAGDPYTLYSQPGAAPPPQPYSSQPAPAPPPPPPQPYSSQPAQQSNPISMHSATNHNNSYVAPPPRNRSTVQGEYVSAYTDYAPPPPQSSTTQYHTQGQPSGHGVAHTHAPAPPSFKRTSSNQVADHFNTSRPSSRGIPRTSSPLVNHVYSAPSLFDESIEEPAEPVGMVKGVGLGLQSEPTAEVVRSREPDASTDRASFENSPSQHWSIVDAEEAERTTEGSVDFEDLDRTVLQARSDPVKSDTHPPQSQARVTSPPVRPPSSTYDPYAPKHTVQSAIPEPPASSRSLFTPNRVHSPPTRPMSAAAMTTGPYAPSQPARVISPPIRSASAFAGASSSGKRVSRSWLPSSAPNDIPDNAQEARALSPERPSAPSKIETPRHHPKNTDSRTRSASNGSMLSNGYPAGHYAPSQHRRMTADKFDNSPYSTAPTIQAHPEVHPSQELTVPASRAPYAPSPSLLGSNDPLGRTNARVPVFTFGFGGKIVSCFHGASLLNTGFDVALSSRKSTILQIRNVKTIVPEATTESSPAVFPGPLFSDPGSPTSLVRTGLSSQSKGKRAKLVKYLEERAVELDAAVGYLQFDPVEKSKVEGKLVLVRLLKIMVENDGRLSGSPEIDHSVRNVLLGRTPEAAAEASDGVFTTAVELSDAANYGLYGQTGDDNEIVIASSTLKQSMLERIQTFLKQGERRQAYHYALDHKLWAHAMVIANSIDKDAWNEAISEFIRAEVGPQQGSTEADPASSGWEALRMAYSSYSGQGAASVGQLAPQNRLAKLATKTGLLAPMTTIPTPATPQISSTIALTKISPAVLSQWMSTLAMLYTNPVTPELVATLTALGDQLAYNECVAPAHVCYLLSAQSSLIGGIYNNAVRIVLLGSPNPQIQPNFHTDTDAVILTEILEYAFSLVPPTKGQEPFGGLPHLQAYKLGRAAAIADNGDVKLAQRYCDAIAACSHKPSPYFGPAFMEQLKNFTDRLVAAPQVEKGSWIPTKMGKPTLGAIGGWIEGRVTKFIEGGPDSEVAKDENTFIGPFSHIGTISSGEPSAATPPQGSATNLNVISPPPPGPSTLTTSAYAPVNRASSAMDYTRKRQNTAPQPATAAPWASSFPQSSSFSSAASSYQDHGNPYGLRPPNMESEDPPTTRETKQEEEEESAGQEVTWWGSGSYGGETPTVATPFHKVDGGLSSNTDGFISLMDNVQSFVATPSPPVSRSVSNTAIDGEDEEDLGLSTKRKPKLEPKAESQTAAEPKQAAAAKPADQANPANAGGSWLGRLFGRGGGGPVKASLGEETSFVFDKELGRWVNKKLGADNSPPAPTPPPPRAQTVSPSTAAPANGPQSHPPTPPIRAATAGNEGGLAAKLPPRIRSNLTPIDSSLAPPLTPPPGTPGLAPPRTPLDRPRSQASKRNVRSRYVDVFQGEGGAA